MESGLEVHQQAQDFFHSLHGLCGDTAQGRVLQPFLGDGSQRIAEDEAARRKPAFRRLDRHVDGDATVSARKGQDENQISRAVIKEAGLRFSKYK